MHYVIHLPMCVGPKVLEYGPLEHADPFNYSHINWWVKTLFVKYL